MREKLGFASPNRTAKLQGCARIGALLALLVLAGASLRCTLTVDLDPKQCSTDADCARRGEKCSADNICVKPGTPGGGCATNAECIKSHEDKAYMCQKDT